MNKIVRIAVALLIVSLLAIVVVNVVSAEGGIAQPARKFNACQFRWVETQPVRVEASDEGYLFDCSFYEGEIPTSAQSLESQLCTPLDGPGLVGIEYRGSTETASVGCQGGGSCGSCNH